MALLELKTDLKSLKNSNYGTKDLLVSKDINDPPKSGGLALQVNSRIDDLTRHTKLLTRKQGLKFLRNQALLGQIGLPEKLKQAKNSGDPKAVGNALLDQAKNTAINTVAATASILAQIPLNGSGVFIPRGISPVTYLKKGGAASDNDSGGKGLFTRIASKVKEVVNSAADDPVPSLVQKRNSDLSNLTGPNKDLTFVDPNSLGGSTKDKTPTYLKPDSKVPFEEYRFYQRDQATVSAEIPDGKGELKTVELSRGDLPNTVDNYSEVTVNNSSDRRPEAIRTKARPNYESYEVEGESWATLNNPIRLYNPGARRTDADGNTTDTENRPDPIQSYADTTATILNTDNEDIIPFEFNTFYPGNTDGYFLAFRAFLDSLNDNFTGEWAGTKYVGRADQLYTYQGFDRKVDFSFKVAAFSKADLVPLYDKLNLLAGSTAPTYNEQGEFMKGTLTKVTIGDYLKEVTGFISSVGLSWDTNSPWEINSDEDIPRVPHILSVSIAFTPIHNFIPTATSRFIA